MNIPSHLHFFESDGGATAVALPFPLDEIIEGWESLRKAMRKTVPDAFSRDEWAYLMTFLSPENLRAPFLHAFGKPLPGAGPVARLARPRGVVAVWLPNNVSLLGPLTLVLLTLTGNRILLKGGSRGDDLAGAFLAFALRHLDVGALGNYLEREVQYDVFERDDPRLQPMLQQADVRIVFGSDEAAIAIHGASPPLRGIGFSFVDRQSQAWIEPAAASDEVLGNLIRVFAIYGQAGCTSPRRVVLLGGTPQDAERIQRRMLQLWPEVLRFRPPMHIASANSMALQWAAACGWKAAAAPDRHAVIGVGEMKLELIDAPMFLPISSATVEEAIEQLPANIQTIGHAFVNPGARQWLDLAARTKIKRLTPIARMHHFGPLWDGQRFWDQCFEEVEVRL
jgi:hypothetical protein